MKRVEEHLKKYYSSKSLPEDKVDILLDKQNSKQLLRKYSNVAIAAMIALGLVFAFFQFQESDMEERVVKEIAMNHNKQLAVEFVANSIDSLQSRLDKLDFSLVPAADVISGDYSLIGGRYCSIQGNLAAQLKIKNNSNNKIDTLYVTGLKGDLNKIEPASLNYDGARIKIWKKDGLLFGLASGI